MNTEQGAATFTWVVTGVGLGLIGASCGPRSTCAGDPLTPYRHAQALLRELIDLSGRPELRPGPGHAWRRHRRPGPRPAPGDRAGRARAPGHGSQPAGHRARRRPPMPWPARAARPPRRPRPAGATRNGNAFAFPLTTTARSWSAVASGLLDRRAAPRRRPARGPVRGAWPSELEPTAVQLDTALLFAALQHEATADERRRLAREMHDGVAQEIASHRLPRRRHRRAARDRRPEQAQLRLLRERITSVVAEVRRSVLTLRTEVGDEREPRRRPSAAGPAPERQLRDPDPGHRRRADHPAAARGGGRAAADRPGGHEQRRQARPARPRSTSAAASTHRTAEIVVTRRRRGARAAPHRLPRARDHAGARPAGRRRLSTSPTAAPHGTVRVGRRAAARPARRRTDERPPRRSRAVTV